MKKLTKSEMKAIRLQINDDLKSKISVDSFAYHPCSPCVQTSPNGGCFDVAGYGCVWISEIGR